MKQCIIIAGPNGAGKTTFALGYLPEMGCCNFVNADLIAAGLSPLAPEQELIAASRLFLREIESHIAEGKDFAFETTLSGKGYLRLIRRLRSEGWRVTLIYLALPSVEYSVRRVAERVAHGGHDIPEEAIRRRFPRSLDNLLNHYAHETDQTLCFENVDELPVLIFEHIDGERRVHQADAYRRLIAAVIK